MTIRKAELRDLADLRKLMYEYIVDFYQCPAPPQERVDALIQACLEGKEGTQFVAEHDGKLCGFATLYYTYSTLRAQRVTIMNDLYVNEAARGTGLGKALFQACLDHTRSNGFAFMQWETAHDNYRAQRLYDSLGGERGDWLTYSIKGADQ
jgi:ribosomal protein S18 acetylase RimI-like enzyme